MHKSHFLTVLFCSLLLYTSAQKQSDMAYLVHTIQKVYAGYPDKDKAGFAKLVEKLGKEPVTDTFAQLSKLTYFFNDLHLLLYDYQVVQTIDTVQCRAQYAAVINHCNNAELSDAREGYWESELGNCIIAIKKVNNNPLTYHGYIVETLTKAPQGLCVLKMVQQPDGYFMTDYVEERMAYRVFLRAAFKNDEVLWVNSYGRWHKMQHYQPDQLSNANRFSFNPSVKLLDGNTVLVTLPDFGRRYVKLTDSLIKAHEEAIAHATTLIVDIRNNMGGVVDNYLPLLPFIYQKPIVHCASFQLCSDGLISYYQELADGYAQRKDRAGEERLKKKIDSLKAHEGSFVYHPADTLIKGLAATAFPKNVALIVNNECISAAELMVLNFKQSNKVKVFGELTGGAVDYLDAISLDVPSKRFALLVATSKREIKIDGSRYDGRGIQPDVAIADTIVDWVKYVKDYYEDK